MSEWQKISTAPIKPFKNGGLPDRGDRILLWTGGWSQIGRYAYTARGKGRWISDSGFVISPTLWQPLPEAPK